MMAERDATSTSAFTSNFEGIYQKQGKVKKQADLNMVSQQSKLKQHRESSTGTEANSCVTSY